MTTLHTILHFTWCLPQTLLGLIIRGCGHGETLVDRNTVIVESWFLKRSFFSLGRYVFYPCGYDLYLNAVDIYHEQGHSKQSLALGWLYLPIIGLPSLLWNRWYYHGKKKKCSYYDFYTEKWANRLAGIDLK